MSDIDIADLEPKITINVDVSYDHSWTTLARGRAELSLRQVELTDFSEAKLKTILNSVASTLIDGLNNDYHNRKEKKRREEEHERKLKHTDDGEG